MRAINARVVSQVEYGPDPRGWGIFAAVAAGAAAAMAGARKVIDPVPTFSGRSRPLQGFTGAANLGVARPTVKDTSTLSDERSAGPLTDAATALFAQRLARRA